MAATHTIKTGPEPGKNLELRPGVNRFGWSPENDFAIVDASVSTFHCEIHVAEIAVSVKDLGSTNGTFINQQRIAKGIIKTGDLLALGGVEFAVQLPEVTIAVPELEQPEQVFAAFLDDGTPACLAHRDTAATMRCCKCENWFCTDCVRQLKRITGEFLHFCPECSGPCEPLPKPTEATRSLSMVVQSSQMLAAGS